MLTRARAFSTATLKVVNNVARQQFTITLGSDAASLNYEESGKAITFITTEVPKAFQGRGVAKILAEAAFSHAQQNKLDVTCKCHYLAKYYNDNINKYKNIKIKFDLEDEEKK